MLKLGLILVKDLSIKSHVPTIFYLVIIPIKHHRSLYYIAFATSPSNKSQNVTIFQCHKIDLRF